MAAYESATCITTARTSPFALIEVAFLIISVVLIFSHKSEIGDESILAQDFRLNEFARELAHGISTGLAIFFATLACCAALHRELQYILGCLKVWRCAKGNCKLTDDRGASRLPKATQSINVKVLFSLGFKAALILLVFNVVVPFSVLKASRHSTIQSWSHSISEACHSVLGRLRSRQWVTAPVLSARPAMYATWEDLSAGATTGLYHILRPELASQVEEVVTNTWQALRTLVTLIITLFYPPLLNVGWIIWRGACYAHLQGTPLFPWIPYTYWLGRLSLERSYAFITTALRLIMSLPHTVLTPWLMLSFIAMGMMTPVFASEAYILKQNIGGVILPLLLSTLAANHVTSLLVFDVVRVLASADARIAEDNFDAMIVVSRMTEARNAATYFRAFQIMTALSTSVVVVLASNMRATIEVEAQANDPFMILSRPESKRESEPHSMYEGAALSDVVQDTTPPSELIMVPEKTLDRNERMPYIPEAEEDGGIGSENQRHQLSNTKLGNDSERTLTAQGGKSSNIDDSSVQGLCGGVSSDLSDVSSSSGVESPACSAQNVSPGHMSRRSEVACATGSMEKDMITRNRRASVGSLQYGEMRRYPMYSEYRTSEGSTSSEPSALLKAPVGMVQSQIPPRPRPRRP